MPQTLGGASNSGILADTMKGGNSPYFYQFPMVQDLGKLFPLSEAISYAQMLTLAIAAATTQQLVAANASALYRTLQIHVTSTVATVLQFKYNTSVFLTVSLQANVAQNIILPYGGVSSLLVNRAINVTNTFGVPIVLDGTLFYKTIS